VSKKNLANTALPITTLVTLTSMNVLLHPAHLAGKQCEADIHSCYNMPANVPLKNSTSPGVSRLPISYKVPWVHISLSSPKQHLDHFHCFAELPKMLNTHQTWMHRTHYVQQLQQQATSSHCMWLIIIIIIHIQ